MARYIPTQLDWKASEYAENYFNDMRLKDDSIVKDFLLLLYDGHTEFSLPDEWSYQLNANNYRYIISELSTGIAGQTDHHNRTVTVDLEHEDDDVVLLHEMIHAFLGLYNREEDFINPAGDKVFVCVYPFIRDALLLCLYNDLSKKIKDLDARILAHANIHNGVAIANEGGSHDILFFLKSLDLDLRCGYELGTVCGYDRDKF